MEIIGVSTVSYRSALLQTYTVWAMFSLLNLDLLFPVLIPLFLPLLIIYCIKFFVFLLPVLVISLLVSVYAFSRFHKILHTDGRKFSPAIFNIIFLIVFLLAGDLVKFVCVEIEISKAKPECSRVNSFSRSLMNQSKIVNPEHAYYVKNAEIFFWSYSELRFVQGYRGAFKQYEQDIKFHCS